MKQRFAATGREFRRDFHMPPPIRHANEPRSNAARESLAKLEPHALRTFTPTQAVLSHSAGVYHWTLPSGTYLVDPTGTYPLTNTPGTDPPEA